MRVPWKSNQSIQNQSYAGVQPWWIQGDLKVGTESASLEITYLITDRERLEMDSVVGKLVEKRRLNNLVYMKYQSPPT